LVTKELVVRASLEALHRLRDALNTQIDYWESHGSVRSETAADQRLTLAELKANLEATEALIADRER
jgi:hypothetical protein